MSMPPPTSETILAKARSLIVEAGYNGFSYADIAALVGIRKASIHHHFPSKSDLVRTLITRYREEAEAGIAQLEQNVADPLNQLLAYIGYWKNCILSDTEPFCICALLAAQISTLPDEVRLEIRAHFRFFSAWLASVLERGVRAGQFKLADTPRAEAESFLATIHGAMLSARAYGDATMFTVITTPLITRLTKP